MSVDLEATLERPVAFADVLNAAREVLSVMLNVSTVPALAVFADREYQQGQRVGQGRRLEPADIMIGVPLTEGAVHFEIDLPATGDGARFMVIDGAAEGWGSGRTAVISPYRTCVGVALATGLALATAQLAGGRYIDEQIGMLSGCHAPDHVIGRTRLLERGDDFTVQCERYLRQFSHLNGWPEDRSIR
ncbi:hypothetical protein [Catenuloplanes atrovinosus]|uniref:Uncharacterized protein n=1 Tax=Catenuloplanes atrovinosus TaxID=137266 RepID=A0AAE3YUD1_9ACTN|nr:hypothetical protein [Catenuloplanes atrovinosus]MDR7278785.1 hypothetical protein [Catenuloplanes atrovinosus]